jgi:hypothetical protein
MDSHADFPGRIVNEDKVNEDEGAREDNCKIEGGVGYDQTVFWYPSHQLKTYINSNF